MQFLEELDGLWPRVSCFCGRSLQISHETEISEGLEIMGWLELGKGEYVCSICANEEAPDYGI